jgi:hypothetical protein
MTEAKTILNGYPLHGVLLDPDQLSLKYCGFEDCEQLAIVEPLYLIVYDGLVCAVCEKCYRTRLRKGDG